jgi:hypothetical protein
MRCSMTSGSGALYLACDEWMGCDVVCSSGRLSLVVGFSLWYAVVSD